MISGNLLKVVKFEATAPQTSYLTATPAVEDLQIFRYFETSWEANCDVVLLTLGTWVPIQRFGNYFARAGLCFLFLKISVFGSIQPKTVNRLESNDQKIWI